MAVNSGLGQALAGIRVLDLTQYIPGPLAAMWLSDLGADVVKIEPPHGDPMEKLGPLDPDGRTFHYKAVNRNKRILRLNLKDQTDHAALCQLITKADVLIEAYRPGVMDRLGFDKARLNQLNPQLIHCSLSGYGQTGPWAKLAGHDLTYVALTGGLYVSGAKDRPHFNYPPLADHAGASSLVTGILAALLTRTRTNLGCHLDISLTESLLAWMGGVLTASHRLGDGARQSGDIDGGAGYYNLYATQDGGFIAFAPLELKFWQVFCAAIDRPDLLGRHNDPMPQESLIQELTQIFKSRTRQEWVSLLGPLDCCVEPVLAPSEVLDHPQWQERGVLAKGQDQDNLVDVAFPVRMDGQLSAARQPLEFVELGQVIDHWAR